MTYSFNDGYTHSGGGVCSFNDGCTPVGVCSPTGGCTRGGMCTDVVMMVVLVRSLARFRISLGSGCKAVGIMRALVAVVC